MKTSTRYKSSIRRSTRLGILYHIVILLCLSVSLILLEINYLLTMKKADQGLSGLSPFSCSVSVECWTLKSEKRNQIIENTPITPKLQLLYSFEQMAKMIGNEKIPVTATSKFLIENPNLCLSVKNLSVVVIVHSSSENFERRQIIRKTWANGKLIESLGTIRIVFMVGKPATAMIQRQIKTESYEFEDILQGDFMDTYRNLTQKGVMGFKWLSERCMNAKYVVKTDDDVIVDTFRLLTDFRKNLHRGSKTIICELLLNSKIIRNKNSKWYVDASQMPELKRYKRYCRGYFVAFSTELIPYLYEASKSTPFFWVDDVYLYGILPSRITGVVYKSLGRDQLTMQSPVLVKCMKTKTCKHLAVGNAPTKLQIEFWEYLQHKHKLKKEQLKNPPV